MQLVQKAGDAAKEMIMEEFGMDAWRSTSLLIQLLTKQESYYESLTEQNPDDDFYTCHIAMSSALELINNSYTVPVSDERFEKVREMYEAVVVTFIRDLSDDAIMDLVYLGGLSNWLAGLRVYAINAWIEETGPSEDKFEMLKLAKRDAKAVELATAAAADAMFNTDEN